MKALVAIAAALRAWLEAIAKRSAPAVEKMLGRLPSQEASEAADFATDADLAILRQEPLRARLLLRMVGIVILLSLLWAAVAQLDEVTRGEARVLPSSQLQVVQSVDGGVVEALLVREGQVVEAGEVLIRVDPTRFMSSTYSGRARPLVDMQKVMAGSSARIISSVRKVASALARESPGPAMPTTVRLGMARRTSMKRSKACWGESTAVVTPGRLSLGQSYLRRQ